jgi:hypothetical protein
MKKIYVSLFSLISFAVSAQIGVNTSNPQGIFNVDAQKNNPVTGVPSQAQQQDDFVVTQEGRVGVGTTAPTAKLEINNGTTAGAIKIVDGTQAEGKFLVSDANGVGTWRETTGTTTVINSTIGPVTNLSNNLTYIGSSAVVTQAGYYIASPRLITDKSPAGCGSFIAYNLFRSATSIVPGVDTAFEQQDVHMASGTGAYDFIYTSNVAYLTAGTYYMWVRYGGTCTTNRTRTNSGQNSFTLTLLK